MPHIVIREGQGGVVGTVGTELTIEDDGTFALAPFTNAQTREARTRGRLGPEARQAIADALKEHAFASLPARLGGTPFANPHEITITAAGRAVTLVTLPGGGPAATTPATGDDDDVRRFVAILGVVRNAVSGEP